MQFLPDKKLVRLRYNRSAKYDWDYPWSVENKAPKNIYLFYSRVVFFLFQGGSWEIKVVVKFFRPFSKILYSFPLDL